MYRLIALLFSVTICGCTSLPKLQRLIGTEFIPSVLVNCNIYDQDFNLVKKLPGGRFCALNKDGSWVSSDVDGIRKFSATGEMLWEHKGHFHHQVIFDSENHVLALTSDFKPVYGVQTRFDAVVKLDQTGKELSRFSFYENFKELLKIPLRSSYEAAAFSPEYKKRVPADVELSHANSIAVFGDGYVINDYMLKSCIFLKKDLSWSGRSFDLQIPATEGLVAGDKSHDCHILEDKSLLYYSNENEVSGKKTYQVLHFNGKEVIFRYPVKPEDFILSKWAGGVQHLNGFYFITTTDRENRTHFTLVNKQGAKQFEKIIDKEFQAGRIMDLTEFLKNNTL